MNGTVFVASPSATARTPVASGSSVPACPAFCACSAQRTLLTTAVDVSPAGLSTTSQPERSRPLRLRAMVLSFIRGGGAGVAQAPRAVNSAGARSALRRHHAHDRAHREAAVMAVQRRNIEPRDAAIEVKRLLCPQPIAKQ